MLRTILGVCGAGLIAFGVFGGQALEGLHQQISGLFAPDTVVVEASSKSNELAVESGDGLPAADSAVTIAAESQAKVPAPADEKDVTEVLAALDAGRQQKSNASDKDADRALEIDMATKFGATDSAPAATATVAAASTVSNNTAAEASKAARKITAETDTTQSKEDGVEVVLSSTIGVPSNDTLFVLKDRVNLREGPSTDHAVVLELDVGQELMEFKRDGKWVHVGAFGTSGKIGWVHGTLVGKNQL